MSIKKEIEKYLDKIQKTKEQLEKVKSATPSNDSEEGGVYSFNDRWFQDLYKFNRRRLFKEHAKCHEAITKCSDKSKTFDYLKKAHIEIVREMRKRGLKHFPKNSFDKETEKILNADEGDKFYLKEIVNKFHNFNRRDIYVWLIGECVKKGFGEKSIDILIQSQFKNKFLEKKIIDMFPKHLRQYIKFHYVPEGPSTDCIPIYVIKYEMPNDDLIDMLNQVKPFNFIRPLNASAEKNMSSEDVVKYIKKYPVNITCFDGDRVQIHKKDGKIKVYSDNGSDITDKVNIKSISKQKDNFIIDCLINKDEINAFDCIWFNERDIHSLNLSKRIEFLESLKFEDNFVLSKRIIAEDSQVLLNALNMVFNNSNNILIRPLWEDYSLKGVSNKWFKLNLKEDNENEQNVS